MRRPSESTPVPFSSPRRMASVSFGSGLVCFIDVESRFTASCRVPPGGILPPGLDMRRPSRPPCLRRVRSTQAGGFLPKIATTSCRRRSRFATRRIPRLPPREASHAKRIQPKRLRDILSRRSVDLRGAREVGESTEFRLGVDNQSLRSASPRPAVSVGMSSLPLAAIELKKSAGF